MPHGISIALVSLVTRIIAHFGYTGVFVGMALSACIPIPSEVILAFAGKETATNPHFAFHLVAWTGAFGNLVGSILAYVVGVYGGRPFVEKYGKYLLIKRHDIDLADRWFQRHGEAAVFWTRMMPVVRAFISLPAGIARMNFARFCVYSFIGGLPWCYLLTWAGLKLGEHWDKISHYLHAADALIIVLLAILLALWLYRHLRPDAVADDPKTAQPI